MKRCARCGRRLNDQATRVYSRFTHAYYCANVAACAKRAKRVHRQKEAAAA